MDKELDLQGFVKLLQVVADTLPSPIVEMRLLMHDFKKITEPELERQMLREWVHKIFKPYCTTDLIQERRDLLKGFIRHIERSLEVYPMRWTSETPGFLEQMRLHLITLELASEEEYWILYDR